MARLLPASAALTLAVLLAALHLGHPFVASPKRPPKTFSVDRDALSSREFVAPSAREAAAPLRSAADDNIRTERGDNDGQLDVDALVKYAAAGATELTLFAATFKALDVLISASGIDPASVPFPLVAALFYVASIKSRAFNPLDNSRPDRDEAMKGDGGSASVGFRDRVMPSWTPPGVVFPIMWLLIIGPIRAYSSAIVYFHDGCVFFHPALLAFIFHLTCGDVWNTINNAERRYGASVSGIVLGVIPSVLFAAYQYYQVDPLAGKLLGGTVLWLATAGALIVDTWRLNPDAESGRRDPLYPVVGEAKTEFLWLAAS